MWYVQAKAKARDCWVVGWDGWRDEMPLNIVFRPSDSEDNAVAWDG